MGISFTKQNRSIYTYNSSRDKMNAEKEALRIQLEKDNAEIIDRLEKENALLREQLDSSKSGLQVWLRHISIKDNSCAYELGYIFQWHS